MSVRALIAPAVFAVFLTGPAVAQQPLTGVVTGSDVARITQIAAVYGTIDRREDDAGVWLRGEMDDTVYSISFLNCNDQHQNCNSVQFRAWWESNGAHTVDAMNQWNQDRRFSSAYLDSRGNATIEWDVNLAHGVPAANFDDSVQWWRTVMRQFREEVIEPGFAIQGGGQSPNSPSRDK
ncbi:YbjN domain-containing protein [Pararhodobacter zhoushanensis]|uniref:YbjN domain-containing protein n=1 Tax=Pararhodobacter zhoushanensis TaxID=2479545 RepID=UPI000F8D74A3|nr:YbjN domain-containing protein [Pararhodobacter zhoushanensis]